MPPKKSQQHQQKKKQNQKSKQESKILPLEPQNPPQPLSLDTYEVDGKVWLLASSNLSLSSFVDPLTDGKLHSGDKDVVKLLSFLIGNPGVEEESESGGQWRFTRYLGAGSFGRVGLWVKESADGEFLDRVAIKELDHEWVGREATKDEPNLPMEVAINRDVNTYDATHIAYLRNYKYGGRACPRGRLYLKHYKYGDLDRLHKAYAIYGHWVPEWFCYEVLRDLCVSLTALSQPPPLDTKVALTYPEGKAGDNSIFETVHQDVKPENVFLDEAMASPDRPAPVLADFGEADYTHVKDDTNPRQFALGGTVGYKPAEELRVKEFLNQENAGEEMDSDDEREALKPIIPSANNAWGIGRVVFELMTHVQGVDFGRCLKINDELTDYDEDYEDYVAQRKFTAKPDKWRTMISKVIHAELVGSFPYSEDLRALVADMLHPHPRKRPNVDEIQRRADEGLKRTLAAYETQAEPAKKGKKPARGASRKQTSKSKLPVLYYTQEQWASMPAGPIKWKTSAESKEDDLSWLRLWAHQLLLSLDPEGPLIKQPAFMKGDTRQWARTSDLQRSMAVEDPESGKLTRMGDVRLRKFKNMAEMEASVKQSAAVNKRKRDTPDEAAEKPPAKKIKKAAGKKDTADDGEEEDAGPLPAKEPKKPQRKGKKTTDKVPVVQDKQDVPPRRNLRERKPVKY